MGAIKMEDPVEFQKSKGKVFAEHESHHIGPLKALVLLLRPLAMKEPVDTLCIDSFTHFKRIPIITPTPARANTSPLPAQPLNTQSTSPIHITPNTPQNTTHTTPVPPQHPTFALILSNTNTILTRAKEGISKPINCLSLHTTTTSPIPRSHVHALCDPFSEKVMLDEYNALITNRTWVLVPPIANVNIVCSMWLFWNKVNAHGSLRRSYAKLYSLSYPVDTESKFATDGDLVAAYHRLYQSLAGALKYLTFTRHALSYAVQQVCLYMHDSRESRFSALKRILEYVHGTLVMVLSMHYLLLNSLLTQMLSGLVATQCSTSGDCVFLEDNLFSWSTKRLLYLD
ncbi:ribonuclease H-like domain-containing protein [Tanacetum coccineum]